VGKKSKVFRTKAQFGFGGRGKLRCTTLQKKEFGRDKIKKKSKASKWGIRTIVERGVGL